MIIITKNYAEKKSKNTPYIFCFCSSDTEIKKDVADTFEIFHKVLGTDPAYFRPPYGSYDDRTERLVSLLLSYGR